MSKSSKLEQVKMCSFLMHSLKRSVSTWIANGCPNYSLYGDGLAQCGATRTQIKNDIVRLRRELNILSKMVDRD